MSAHSGRQWVGGYSLQSKDWVDWCLRNGEVEVYDWSIHRGRAYASHTCRGRVTVCTAGSGQEYNYEPALAANDWLGGARF